MADAMVLYAQQFVNAVYGDRIGMTVEEDGRTGWNTMYALTRALQWELGITALSNNFGPTTLATLTSKYPALNATTMPSKDFCRIIQAALYCKGYDGGNYIFETQDFEGIYETRMQNAVSKLKAEMGVAATYPGSDLTPKVFKGLLNMDPYVVVNDGSDQIRAVQQWLNGRYITRADFFVMPCDGHNSRGVAQSMLFAIQYELGMADGTANGNFGPGTKAGLKSHTVSPGSTGIWVSLFTAAMLLNARDVVFASTFSSDLADEVRAFQSFVKLPVTGAGDFSTWASLLVSHGDQDRQGEACDGVTKITPARAATLKALGVKYVGRYLTNPSVTQLPEKVVQPGELQTIAEQGLRCFPIYQTFGGEASQFNYALGRAAGYAAINAAEDYGFKHGTLIYFAVDFDALDQDVTSNILPHFKGIEDALSDSGNPYRVGVYGPRNVCTRVAQAGHSVASFVSDMSYGFSGNYGYPLPADWAFDQIVTKTVGSGDGSINIDNDIASGRDTGQNSFNAPRPPVADTLLNNAILSAMEEDTGKYMQSIGFPNDGGTRTYSHFFCFMSTIAEHDALITALSHLYSMRKALIQTSAYWEMRHIGPEDDLAELAVEAYHSGLPGERDCSTGIAQINGTAAINAWNYCINNDYASGTITDPSNDTDVYVMWNMVKDNAFALRTVALLHLWAAAGKPGGNNPPGGETVLRPVSLDYVDSEIFEILRRYQGWGDDAVDHAKKRMALYHLFEKYDGISRNG